MIFADHSIQLHCFIIYFCLRFALCENCSLIVFILWYGAVSVSLLDHMVSFFIFIFFFSVCSTKIDLLTFSLSFEEELLVCQTHPSRRRSQHYLKTEDKGFAICKG